MKEVMEVCKLNFLHYVILFLFKTVARNFSWGEHQGSKSGKKNATIEVLYSLVGKVSVLLEAMPSLATP